LWTRHLGDRIGTRAPHVAKNAGSGMYGDWAGKFGGDWWVVEGIPPFPAGLATVAGFEGEELSRLRSDFDYWRDGRKSIFDPAARIGDMDKDTVAAEVIFPSYMPRMFYMRDADLQRRCAEICNDWITEYCQTAPSRLIGTASISLVDAVKGAKELERCVKRGLRGALIWCVPPPELSFASSHYDPFWAAAQEANVPVSLHALPPLDTAWAAPRAKSTFVDDAAMGLIEDGLLAWVLFDHQIQRSLAQLVLSGVFERFPRLRVVACEWGTSWIPNFMANLDSGYKKRPRELSLKLKPSEYLLRNVWYTFDRAIEYEPADHGLEDRLLWASDFPHIESSWPHSRQAFDRFVSPYSEALQTKLGGANCASLYAT
jgi:predicted TIM-barrel fold metal-dependent hydrolase